MSRLVGRAETLNRIVPHPQVAVKNWEVYVLDSEVSSEKGGVPASYWAPKPGASVLGRRISTTSACENKWVLRPAEKDGCCRLRFPLKGPSIDSFTHKHLPKAPMKE